MPVILMQVVGLNYKVLSPSCNTAAASAPATASIPQKALEAPVIGPVFGPALYFDKHGKGGSQSASGTPAGFSSGASSSSSQSGAGQKQVGQAGQEGERGDMLIIHYLVLAVQSHYLLFMIQ